MGDDTEIARLEARVDESLAKQLQKSIELNSVLAAEIKELKSREPLWTPINVIPAKSGKYLVGHRGWQEIMWYFGTDKEWMPRTPLGWHASGDHHVADDPQLRFKATHYLFLDPIIAEIDLIRELMEWSK